MKSVLVPVDHSEIMPSVMASAEHLARRFESIVEGAALRPVHVEIVAPDPIVAVTFPPADWNDAVRTVITFLASVACTVWIALPA